jgi:hypothetical protein
MLARLKPHFPQLSSYFWKQTSDASNRYNCIAFAVSDTKRNWWPIQRYWPREARRVTTVAAFEEAFLTKGFVACADGVLEEGFDKIVLYVDQANVPTHAAKQVVSGEHAGSWSSKLGEFIDILHEKPESLSGPVYGIPKYFFKRDRRTHQEIFHDMNAPKVSAEKKRKAIDKKKRCKKRKRRKG